MKVSFKTRFRYPIINNFKLVYRGITGILA